MAANRLLDAELDARNPRTAGRAIPSGRALAQRSTAPILARLRVRLRRRDGGLLDPSTPTPGRSCSRCPVLLFLCAYPLLKRFTRLCHYYLGAALALAPVCAWIAVTRRRSRWPPLLMAAAVLCWTAGFDIIYACQDYRATCATGVFSVPAKLGIGPALWVRRLTHVVCVALLMLLGCSRPRSAPLYFAGVAIAIVLLVVEHSARRPNDLSKVGLAFFTVNGIISLLIGTLGIIDVFV